MSHCPYGCRPGYAVCEEGKHLLAEGLYLQSLFPPVLPLPLSDEQERFVDRFHVAADRWLKHIGAFTPDRHA